MCVYVCVQPSRSMTIMMIISQQNYFQIVKHYFLHFLTSISPQIYSMFDQTAKKLSVNVDMELSL